MQDLSFTAPEVSTPSISSSAMLVELSISVWTGRKKDRKAQAQVEADNQTAKNMTNVTKKLMGDHPLLTQIQKHAAYIRTNIHYDMTLPWSDTGPRALTTARYFDYHKRMGAAKAEHEELVTRFLDEYEYDLMSLQARQQALGQLFNASDYPSVSELTNKFGFRLNYMPMPETGDFRLDVGTEAQEVLKAAYADFYQRKTVEAMNDVWKRSYKVLTHVSERLADPEPGFAGVVTKEGRKKFSDTLIEDIVEMTEVLKTCNITQDEKMLRMERHLSEVLFGLTTDAVKDDRALRLDTKQQIDDAIANLPSLDF